MAATRKPPSAAGTGKGKREFGTLGWAIFLGSAFAITLYLFVTYKEELYQLAPQYAAIIILIAALVPTFLLFGGLRSTAKYTGIKVLGGSLDLGGAAAFYLALVYFTFSQTRESPFSATVNVFSRADSTEAVAAGQVNLLYGQAALSRPLSEGQATFKEIPADYKGKPLQVLVRAEGYLPQKQRVTILRENSAINIYLDKVADEVVMNGTVINKRGQPISNATLYFGDEKSKAVTDSMGMYSVTIPCKDGEERNVKIYLGRKLEFNGHTTISGKGNRDFMLVGI